MKIRKNALTLLQDVTNQTKNILKMEQQRKFLLDRIEKKTKRGNKKKQHLTSAKVYKI